MKRRTLTLSLATIVCLTGILNSTSASAENPFEKFIPRGKLLKKLKNEITGEPTAEREPAAGKAADGRPSTPTPAARPDGPSQTRVRSTRPRSTRNESQSNLQARHRHAVPTPAGARRVPTPSAAPDGAANAINKTPRPDTIAAARGFGMIVQPGRGDGLFVTRLHPQGNAAKAGFKPGDQVIGAGGVELTSLEEYDQITSSLGAGDQIEIEIDRRGREEKLMLQFGTALELPASAEVPAGNSASSTRTTEASRPIAASRYGNRSTGSMPSVLDGPAERVQGPVARVSQLPQEASAGSNRIQSLHQTIQSQQQAMQRMKEELAMLRRTNQPAIEPVANNWKFSMENK